MNRIKNINEFQSAPTVTGNLLAPNGKPSNLSKKLYDTVRTYEFKKWFGDWENDPKNASKVVDENGEPLVVYHGTQAYGFTEFLNTYDLPRGTDNETNTLGIWFTNSKTTAKDFMFDSTQGGIYEVFLNIRNPKMFKPAMFSDIEKESVQKKIDDLTSEQRRLGHSTNNMTPENREKFQELKLALKDAWHQWKLLKHTDSFEQFMNYRDKYAEYDYVEKGKIGGWLERYINKNKNETNKKLVHEFQTNKHDGIYISETQYDAKEDTINQYVVFDPKDIKALDSKTFDKNSTNIHENNDQKTSGEGIYNKISNKNEDMEQTDKLAEGNDFTEARQKAIDAGEDTFEVDGKTYDVTGDTSNEKKQNEGEEAAPEEEETETAPEEEEETEETDRVAEMDTFNVTKRRIKTFAQFKSGAKKIAKTEGSEHEIVKDGYSGEKTGKKATETLEDRKEKKGKHETVKAAYSGDVKGKKGLKTMDDQQKKA